MSNPRRIPASTSEGIPLRRVRSDGQVEQLGRWHPAGHRLELSRPGYPLLAPGIHEIEGDLPWVFDEMAPDGFLAARFARWFPDLKLPPLRIHWTVGNVIDALSVKGHDLAGNLIVGETSYQTFLRLFRSGIDPGPRREAAAPLYGFFVDQILQEPAQSSVGGARPKFALRLADGSGLIVKFTPPLSTAAGQRWADLLRMEAHASSVLRSAGLESVHCRYLELDNRGYLEIERFDRVAGGGRVGHVTLFHLGAACYSEVADPATVVQNLVRDGHLRPDDEHCFRRIHEFSGAIGNDDTHQGNYGLLIDDAGLARLAPAYDVVPMAFAPRHDELPDRFVKGMNQQRGRETAKLVSQLVEEVRADPGITPAFRDAWTECVAEPA